MLVARAGGDTRPDRQTKAFFWKKRGSPPWETAKEEGDCPESPLFGKGGSSSFFSFICWIALRFYFV
jgi:hypothetical protein